MIYYIDMVVHVSDKSMIYYIDMVVSDKS
jgi:hypothetical protein